jgi:hypothetical protein
MQLTMKTFTYTPIELRIVILKAMCSGLKTINEIDHWIELGMPFNPMNHIIPTDLNENIHGEFELSKGCVSVLALENNCQLYSFQKKVDAEKFCLNLHPSKILLFNGCIHQINGSTKIPSVILDSMDFAGQVYYRNYNKKTKDKKWLLDPVESFKSACVYKNIVVIKNTITK